MSHQRFAAFFPDSVDGLEQLKGSAPGTGGLVGSVGEAMAFVTNRDEEPEGFIAVIEVQILPSVPEDDRLEALDQPDDGNIEIPRSSGLRAALTCP